MAKHSTRERVARPKLPDEMAADRVEHKRDKLQVHRGVVRRQLLQQLDAFHAPAANDRVSSYYLDLDPQRRGGVKEARIAVKDAMQSQRDRIEELDVPRAVRIALRSDWEDVIELAPTVIGDRHARARMFCRVRSSPSLALTSPWPFNDQAFFENQFVTWPLKQIMDQFDRYAVCLTDKEDARLFFVYLERIEELGEFFDEVPGRVRIADPQGELKYNHKHVELFHRHFAHAAEAALRLFQQEPFEHLIIGGRSETLPQFEGYLHRYLRDRIVARWEMDVRATAAEVLERAIDEERRVVEQQADEIWKTIQDARSQRRR